MEPMSKSELRTGNVLFMDVVGYSRRTADRQSYIVETLNQLVRETPTMRATPEENRLCLPTGDGVVVSFFDDPSSPARCALELDEQLKEHNRRAPEEQRFELRMGINHGPVRVIKDINRQDNLSGDGINRAQRVMDCGDAGHILIAQEFAGSLSRADSTLESLFHPLGEFEVKHGELVAIANVYDGTRGNREMPTRKPRVAAEEEVTKRKKEKGPREESEQNWQTIKMRDSRSLMSDGSCRVEIERSIQVFKRLEAVTDTWFLLPQAAFEAPPDIEIREVRGLPRGCSVTVEPEPFIIGQYPHALRGGKSPHVPSVGVQSPHRRNRSLRKAAGRRSAESSAGVYSEPETR